MASNSIAPIPCCVSKNDGCKSAHGVIFLRRRAVARWVRKNKHSNDNPGNNKVTCCRLGSAAIQDTLSIESENHLLPVHADEIFAVPFRHAPTRDHNVCTLSRDEDMHGVPSRRPSASEWATCYVLSKSSRQKWHPQKQDASASTAKVLHFHQERPANLLRPRVVRLFWSEKTHTLARNDFRLLLSLRAVTDGPWDFRVEGF